MQRFVMMSIYLAFLLVGVPGGRAGVSAAAQTYAVAEEDIRVTLGDGWVSAGKVAYPAGQPGPSPTVLLIYPGDMDFTIPGDSGLGPGVRYFKDLADYLAGQGIASVRYNSRHITSADDAANERVRALRLPDFAADAERVLEAMRSNPRIDARRIFLYGWSYSSSLVADLAARHPDLAGVIMQGPTASTRTEIFVEDYLDNTLPYLLQFAPDGQITAETLRRAQAGNGTFAKFSAADLQDPTSPDVLKVNPLLDTNGDGVLDLSGEIVPQLTKLVEADASGLVKNLRALPSVYDQAPAIHIPVLVLQGEADTAVRVRNTRGLDQAFAWHPDYTLNVYPGLGHALFPVPSRFEDLFGPMDARPKRDIVAWVVARAAPVPTALPRTGETPGPDKALAVLAAFLLFGGVALQLAARKRRLPAVIDRQA